VKENSPFKFALRGSNVKGEFSFTDNLKNVVVDVGQISQVINNLIINAIQAMPNGGNIEVIARNTEVAEGGNFPLKPGDYIEIIIKDHGIGIQREYIRKIFDPYFTTKQKGSGLGLATTYSIIKNHDGHISVYSNLDQGSEFTIYLPATDSEPEQETEAIFVDIKGAGRILIMDDEVSIRRITGLNLQKLGYETDFAVDGQEAIDKYTEAFNAGNKYDAVILDLTIPGGFGGKDTIKVLSELDPDIKAIVSSGYSNDPIMADYTEYGFAGMVRKPYKASDLAKAVNDIVAVQSENIPNT